eukprot:8622303-Pyramimonas_sp.AAC.1
MGLHTHPTSTTLYPTFARSGDSPADDWQSAEIAEILSDGPDALTTAAGSSNAIVQMEDTRAHIREPVVDISIGIIPDVRVFSLRDAP